MKPVQPGVPPTNSTAAPGRQLLVSLRAAAGQGQVLHAQLQRWAACTHPGLGLLAHGGRGVNHAQLCTPMEARV